jgi:isoaspartyl peptidase/L-asparaginase-like protein (Ntn-hydrolase superfamily)
MTGTAASRLGEAVVRSIKKLEARESARAGSGSARDEPERARADS